MSKKDLPEVMLKSKLNQRKMAFNFRLPERYKEKLMILGDGNMNAGLLVVLETFEAEIDKALKKVS